MQLRNILCAVDLSDHSVAVLRCAVGLAQRYRSRLLVFHAVYAARDQIYGTTLFERSGEQTELMNRARQSIGSLMQAYDLTWEPLVRSGEPVATAARIAEEMDVDLVIAASHGLTGVKRILFGEVVERLARTVSRPLLLVREHLRTESDTIQTQPLVLKRILAGCSLKPDSQPVIRYAAELARDWDAALDVVHAMDSPLDDTATESIEGPYGDVQQQLEARLRDRLIRLVLEAAFDPASLNAAVLPGPPGEVLLACCRRTPTNLVVVGVRHHSKVGQVILGSTTEAMLRHAPCSVLSVPAHS